MEIHVPTSAEPLLREQAARAGYATVEDYALAVLLPSHQSTPPSGSSPSFYESALASGLIEGGAEYAADLSSNPAHLEGFGQ